MSKFVESFAEVEVGRFDVPQLSVEFAQRFPNLAAALSGEMDEVGAKFKRFPATVTFWFERDRFKFVLSPRFSSKIAFGSGTDGLGGFSEIEQAIELGHFEWKLRGGQKRS